MELNFPLTLPVELSCLTTCAPQGWSEYKFWRWWLSNRARRHTTIRRAAAVLEALGDLRGKTVLDIGCAWGYSSLLAAAKGARVVSLDVVPGHLALARQLSASNRLPLKCCSGDAVHLPFPDNSFDRVIHMETLEHIGPGWREGIAGMARVLKPEGVGVLSTPNVVGIAQVTKKVLTRLPVFKKIWDPDENFVPDQEIRRAVGASGLTLIKRQVILFTVPFCPDVLFPLNLWMERVGERFLGLRHLATTAVYQFRKEK